MAHSIMDAYPATMAAQHRLPFFHRHPLVAYFLLADVFSWLIAAPLMPRRTAGLTCPYPSRSTT
jgi:hypothetical protein